MTIRERVAAFLLKGTPLSIRDPAHWRNRDDAAPSGESVNAGSVLGLSAAWACTNLLMGTIATLPVMLYRTLRDGSRELAVEHPLYRVLHDSPNSLQTAVDFWEFASGSVELQGNGYARKIKSGDRIVGLVPISPDLPSVDYAGNGSLRYRWSENGTYYDLTSDDVFHIRGPGGNPLGGMSTLAVGAKTFGLAIAIDRAAGATFKNGLRPSVNIAFEKFLTDPQRKIVEAKLEEKYQGAMNAGRPFITEGGTTLHMLSINPEDAQMLESRGFGVEEICRFFGVPPFMIGHTEKSTSWGTGLEQQTLGFVKFTLRRRLKRIEQAIEKQLLSPRDRADGLVVEFNLEGLLRGDSTGRAAFYAAALGDTQKPAWMLRNEVRRLENLPPVDGWDEPIPLISQQPAATTTPALPKPPTPQKDDDMKLLTKEFGGLKSFDYRLSIEAKDVGAEGEFEGYASTFGNVDQGGDLVEPGAFIESVVAAKNDGRTIPMLWQHDQREPIGIWKDIAEDKKGLWVKGQLLIDADPLAKRAHGLLKAKALGGMSIGYRIPAGGAEPHEKKPGIMRLVKVDLREISLVTMPMNIQARVTTVKSILDDGKLPTVREFEEFLRDAGFSKTLATALATKATPHLRGDPDDTVDEVLELLRALSA